MARKTKEQKLAEEFEKKKQTMEWYITKIRSMQPNLQKWLKKVNATFDIEKMSFSWIMRDINLENWFPVTYDLENMSEEELDELYLMFQDLRSEYEKNVYEDEKENRRDAVELRLYSLMTELELSEFDVTVTIR